MNVGGERRQLLCNASDAPLLCHCGGGGGGGCVVQCMHGVCGKSWLQWRAVLFFFI